MYIHPELGLRLAERKIEEAQCWSRHATALRAATLNRQASGVSGGTRRHRWAALMLATVSRSRVRRRSLDASPEYTVNVSQGIVNSDR
jgi:hypothetical protein